MLFKIQPRIYSSDNLKFANCSSDIFRKIIYSCKSTNMQINESKCRRPRLSQRLKKKDLNDCVRTCNTAITFKLSSRIKYSLYSPMSCLASALALSQQDTVEFSVISEFLTSFLCDFGVEGFLWSPTCRLSPVVRSP